MLVDSNILIYAINISSPKHLRAQQFLQRQAGNFSVAHQNIFETLRVLTHPKFPNPMKPDMAIEAVRRIISAGHIVFPDYKTHELALIFINQYSLIGDKIFDAYLVATALVNGIKQIASDNVKDLKMFTKIEVLNPFS